MVGLRTLRELVPPYMIERFAAMPSLDCIQPASCNGCGLCCQGIGSPVVLYTSNPDSWGPHPFRPAALPDDLIREIDDHFLGLHRGQEPQEQCLWYDAATRSCRHYEWRPQVCRDYELGGSECLALRQRHIEGERPREIAADEG